MNFRIILFSLVAVLYRYGKRISSLFTNHLNRSIKIVLILFIGINFFSCKNGKEIHYEKEYSRWIGDIEYDASVDDPNFKICNGEDEIIQYFNVSQGPVFVGEKSSLLRTFETKYKPIFDKNQNGLIRIRFVVNCEGHAGRFRILQADSKFNATEFDSKIVLQLIETTKEIEDWVILYNEDAAVDYYFYLIFRITNGQISKILP